ncbi:hypothetical protein ACTXT7_014048 [Hymenolepis weldensis]
MSFSQLEFSKSIGSSNETHIEGNLQRRYRHSSGIITCCSMWMLVSKHPKHLRSRNTVASSKPISGPMETNLDTYDLIPSWNLETPKTPQCSRQPDRYLGRYTDYVIIKPGILKCYRVLGSPCAI